MSLVVKRPTGRYNLRFACSKAKEADKEETTPASIFLRWGRNRKKPTSSLEKSWLVFSPPFFLFFSPFFVPPTKRSLVGI